MSKIPFEQDPNRGRRLRAYMAGGRIARERIAREAPLDDEALARIRREDVVVVRGAYDRVEQVLDALAMPYTIVEPGQVAQLRLRPEQLLVINCPGHIEARGIERIRSFVASGGSLFTTDWALRHVLEPAFPGLVAYNDRATADDVVRIEVCAHDNPFLKGVMDGQDDPIWWLEGSSYPIRILDPERVEVLLTSRELEGKYGEAPVAIRFACEKGEVFHMISHYYLQRTELRNARHVAPAAQYAGEKDVAVLEDLAGLTVGEVESAQTSARLFANVAAAKKRRSS